VIAQRDKTKTKDIRSPLTVRDLVFFYSPFGSISLWI